MTTEKRCNHCDCGGTPPIGEPAALTLSRESLRELRHMINDEVRSVLLSREILDAYEYHDHPDYADAVHGHGDHDHEDRYADPDHSHEYYAEIEHWHDGEYAGAEHEHDRTEG